MENKVSISLIVAKSKNNVIGNKSSIPWNLPSDRRRFAEITKGHMVVMGRKTYESLPDKFRPLPNRTNVVLTKNKSLNFKGCIMAYSWEDALKVIRSQKKEVFIIGGEHIYKIAAPFANKIYETCVDTNCKGDSFFPRINEDDWVVIHEEFCKNKKDEFPYTFRIRKRRSLFGSFVYIPHSRVESQNILMQKILKDNVCPFCPENILSYHPNEIIKDTKWWLLTEVAFPYKNSRKHFLIICKKHLRHIDELAPYAFAELIKIISQIRKEYEIDGATLLWRFGDIRKTGASVDHLHAHIIVGDGKNKIKIRVG